MAVKDFLRNEGKMAVNLPNGDYIRPGEQSGIDFASIEDHPTIRALLDNGTLVHSRHRVESAPKPGEDMEEPTADKHPDTKTAKATRIARPIDGR